MAKEKKPFWSRFFMHLLIFLVVVLLLAVGGYLFVRFYYGVDLITTLGQVRKLSKEVSIESFTNRFDDSDKQSLQTVVNTKAGGTYIVYSDESGYYVDNDATLAPTSDALVLSDKECGALIDVFMNNSDNKADLKLGNLSVGFKIIQVQFANLNAEDNSVQFNVVTELDLTAFKAEKFPKFPLNLIGKAIPNKVYMNATVTVTKDTTEAFKYVVSNGKISINSLSEKETEDLFNNLKKFVNFTSADELAKQFATPFVDALISGNNSLAKSFGSDFQFVAVGDVVKLSVA